jgi:putative ABC transport system permease protein
VLNKQYILLALIAFVLAAPASWYIMNQWLADFKFKIDMGWELFVISMVAGLLIALFNRKLSCYQGIAYKSCRDVEV